MRFIVKYTGWHSQLVPWTVGIRWPDGKETLLYGYMMGTWQKAFDEALKLSREMRCVTE